MVSHHDLTLRVPKFMTELRWQDGYGGRDLELGGRGRIWSMEKVSLPEIDYEQ